MILSAQFDDADGELLKRLSKARGEDVSSFIRRAVRAEFARLGYLSSEEAKALGIGVQETQAVEAARVSTAVVNPPDSTRRRPT